MNYWKSWIADWPAALEPGAWSKFILVLFEVEFEVLLTNTVLFDDNDADVDDEAEDESVLDNSFDLFKWIACSSLEDCNELAADDDDAVIIWFSWWCWWWRWWWWLLL